MSEPQEVLDGVQDDRMGRQVVSPAEVELGMPQRLRYGPSSQAARDCLEGSSKARRLGRRQDRHREEDPILLVLLDLRRRQELAHVVPPHTNLALTEPRRVKRPVTTSPAFGRRRVEIDAVMLRPLV